MRRKQALLAVEGKRPYLRSILHPNGKPSNTYNTVPYLVNVTYLCTNKVTGIHKLHTFSKHAAVYPTYGSGFAHGDTRRALHAGMGWDGMG